MADVRSPILVCELSWELLCVLLRMRLICSEIAGNVTNFFPSRPPLAGYGYSYGLVLGFR